MDFDWSNAKKVWAAAKPMNCEEMLVEQVLNRAATPAAASPPTHACTVGIGLAAMPHI